MKGALSREDDDDARLLQENFGSQTFLPLPIFASRLHCLSYTEPLCHTFLSWRTSKWLYSMPVAQKGGRTSTPSLIFVGLNSTSSIFLSPLCPPLSSCAFGLSCGLASQPSLYDDKKGERDGSPLLPPLLHSVAGRASLPTAPSPLFSILSYTQVTYTAA